MSLQVLLTLFLTLTRVSAKHKKFSIELLYSTLDKTVLSDHNCGFLRMKLIIVNLVRVITLTKFTTVTSITVSSLC